MRTEAWAAGKDLYPVFSIAGSGRSPEDRLLVLLSRLRLDDEARFEAASLAGAPGLNWNDLSAMADFNEVTPLVYRHLLELGPAVPGECLNSARAYAASCVSRSAAQLRTSSMLAGIFAETGARALFLKGAATASDVYGDPSLRASSDIDILAVDDDSLRKIDAALLKNGFVRSGGDAGERYRAEILYTSRDHLPVDLHKGFAGLVQHDLMLGFDREGLWSGKRDVALGEARVNTLGLVDDLVYQCLHLSLHHSFAGLKWYVDINEFIGKYGREIDWDAAMGTVVRHRIRRPVYYSLLFTKGLFGTGVPGAFMEKLKAVERASDNWVFTRIRSGKLQPDYLAELAMFDSYGEALIFILRNILAYPALLRHFLSVAGRIARGLVAGQKAV